jgi:hypothetical protein
LPRFALVSLALTCTLSAQGLTWITNPATGNQYARTPIMMSWSAANAYAETVDATLCVIDDAAENAWVAEQFLFLFPLYLGGTDQFLEGHWTTAHGWPLAYTNWSQAPAISQFQPDGSGDYLVMWDANPLYGVVRGTWDDQPGTAANYAVLERPVPQFVGYGTGCAGSNGVPTLTPAAGSPGPAPGATITMELGNLPACGGAAIGILSLAPLQVDLGIIGMPSCLALLDPGAGWMVPVFHAADAAVWQQALPNLTAIRGIKAYTQALVLDAAAGNPLGATTTAGLELRLGF